MIVIGTSLKVAPVAEVPGILPRDVPQILISRDVSITIEEAPNNPANSFPTSQPVSHIDFDIDMLGECDVVVSELCRRAGWDLRHEMIPKDLTVEVSLNEGYVSRYRFTALKP